MTSFTACFNEKELFAVMQKENNVRFSENSLQSCSLSVAERQHFPSSGRLVSSSICLLGDNMVKDFWRQLGIVCLHQVLCRPPSGGPRLDCWARIQSGRGNFGVFSTSCFVPSALSSDFFTTMYFSPTLLRFSLTFHLLFRTFDVLLGWILLREYLFLENNIPDLGFLGLSNAIYMKLP